MEDSMKPSPVKPLIVRAFDWDAFDAYVSAANLEVVRPRNG